MNLRDRLKQITPLKGEEPASVPPETIPQDAASKGDLPGKVISRDEGCFLLRREEYAVTEEHGDLRFEDALGIDPKRAALLGRDASLHALSVRDCVFLDTETTSLSGGAGVYVFLTGLAFFEDQTLVFEQYFMRDFDEEETMLLALSERLRQFQNLVSFFGKNFDVHRLISRFRLHRIPVPFPARHYDLCHASRRIWGKIFPDVRLNRLEREVLGVRRESDLPGAECPEAYFDYLRGIDDGRVARVLEHNLIDVLSLVTLLARMDSVAKEPSEPHELFALGRLLHQSGDSPRALEALTSCLEVTGDDERRAEALKERAYLLKKMRRHDESFADFETWHSMQPTNSEVLVEMAKHLEHRTRDYERALQLTRQGLETLRSMRRIAFDATLGNRLEDLEKRERRLQARIGRSAD